MRRIEKRGAVNVLCDDDGNGCMPATRAEIEFYAEITRLSAEVDALKRTHDEAMKRSHEVTQEMARQFETEVEALRAKATAFDWLQAEHDRFDPMARCVIKRSMDRRNGDWIEFIDGENFAAIVLREASIDAARAAQGGKT